MSTGANTGYGGAATLVAERVEFDTMVLCNDDLVFTDASMEALRTAVGAHRDEAAIIGFLPRERPGIVPLPGAGGVVSVVSGLAGATRSRRERKAGGIGTRRRGANRSATSSGSPSSASASPARRGTRWAGSTPASRSTSRTPIS